MSRLLTWAFVASCVLYALVVVWAAFVLPAEGVPSHWSSFGRSVPDAWSTRAETVGFLALIGGALAAVYTVILVLVRRSRTMGLINVPNQAYWMREENLPQARRMMYDDMALFAAVFMVWFTSLPVSIVQAAHDPQGRLPLWFTLGFVAWLVFTAGWMVRLYRRFRMPPDAGPLR